MTLPPILSQLRLVAEILGKTSTLAHISSPLARANAELHILSLLSLFQDP